MSLRSEREVRAVYCEKTIRVYQAYSPEIGDRAVASQSLLVPGFGTTRMTWIKPSFLWMMYRSGWAAKDALQTRVLAIDILRSGFDWALSCGLVNEAQAGAHHKFEDSPVVIQWDPDRDLRMARQSYRAIQIGLRKEAVKKYTEEWIVKITDMTELAHRISAHVQRSEIEEATALLPVEITYPLDKATRERLGAD